MKHIKFYENFNTNQNLTTKLKNNAISFKDLKTLYKPWIQNPGQVQVVPKFNWNENAGKIVFSDENGEAYVTCSTNELRTLLYKDEEWTKNHQIGVPWLEEDQWVNKNRCAEFYQNADLYKNPPRPGYY
jgi:hypothetical protein